MTANSSATGGALLPTVVAGSFGTAFNKLMHDWLLGLTGLTGNYIMPRWQLIPPNIPNSETTDWMTFGITRKKRLGTDYRVHFSNSSFPLGGNQSTRWEKFWLLCSMYGPNQDLTETKISQGIFEPQNSESLLANYIRPISTNETVIVPELIKSVWITHWDLEIEFIRAVVLDYNINDLTSATGQLKTDTGLTETITN